MTLRPLPLVALANLLIGLALALGGASALVARWREPLTVMVALMALPAGLFLGFSGAALWRRPDRARTVALPALGATLAWGTVATLWGFLGIPGFVLTVAYPVLATLVVLRADRPRTSPGVMSRPGQRTKSLQD
jgi:hypothetical protein